MKPVFDENNVQIYHGDCRQVLAQMPAESVDCVVTSPPYFGLRSYGIGAEGGEIGQEQTPEGFVAEMVNVFRGVRRVLSDKGTLWLNLGDSYAGGKMGRADSGSNGRFGGIFQPPKQNDVPDGLKQKDLIGIPWRVALALQADGWYLRQDIIWHKPNPMPESVTDRCTKAHEYIFLLSKSEKYHFNSELIAEPVSESSLLRWNQDIENQAGSFRVPGKTNGPMKAVGGGKIVGRGVHGSSIARGGDRSNSGGFPNEDGTRNKRSVWTVTTQPFGGAHFATFPPELIKPCIKAGVPENGVCLDPFFGSGTTGVVCQQQHVRCVGIELNEKYIEIASKRLSQGVLNFTEAK